MVNGQWSCMWKWEGEKSREGGLMENEKGMGWRLGWEWR
jgi:hypothetical protein